MRHFLYFPNEKNLFDFFARSWLKFNFHWKAQFLILFKCFFKSFAEVLVSIADHREKRYVANKHYKVRI